MVEKETGELVAVIVPGVTIAAVAEEVSRQHNNFVLVMFSSCFLGGMKLPV